MNSPTSAGARTDELKRAAIGHMDRITPVLVELSHRIHATPELALAEYQAVRALIGVARAEGLTIEPSAYGLETAFAVDSVPRSARKWRSSPSTTELLAREGAFEGVDASDSEKGTVRAPR